MESLEPSGRTVLLVDDNEMLRRAFVRGASARGIQVIAAEDGVSALNLARSCMPDAIILDISLPRLDGRDVLTALKRDPETAHVPVIVISGHCQQTHRNHVLELGAQDYVEKPFDVRVLLRKILSCIEKCHNDPPSLTSELGEQPLPERQVKEPRVMHKHEHR